MPSSTRRPPLLAIVGRKNAGKTTLVVRLAATLSRRGHRVMTIKHGSHTFNIDPVTTDTYRHYHEGMAERVAMVSPDKFALVTRLDAPLSAEEVASLYMSDADVVVCEGFKASALPRVEVHRSALHAEPLALDDLDRADLYRAIVTDDPTLNIAIPLLPLDADDCLDRLADLVERDVMER
ncbi:MAG: Molybdopterin-guanine dinucleotide biosynthesis adapter protein [Gemmatimonadaceae bacterium]|nr:Molybdopterin-guanine dinucleotide biosynthesis adapter protein [Gemmatimonadaceae bacterium]